MNKKFITKGAKEKFPLSLILFMWNVHSNHKDRDYLTVFEFKTVDGYLTATHRQEEPEFSRTYELKLKKDINATVFIIDEDHDDFMASTMMLSEEH